MENLNRLFMKGIQDFNWIPFPYHKCDIRTIQAK